MQVGRRQPPWSIRRIKKTEVPTWRVARDVGSASAGLGAGAAVAAGRGGGAGGGALRGGRRAGGGARHVAGDGAGDGGLAGAGRALRAAARARVPAVVAAGLPARGVDGGDRARRGDGGGLAGGGIARSGSDRDLCGGAKRAGVDRVVLARAARVSAADAGPAAPHARRVSGWRDRRVPGPRRAWSVPQGTLLHEHR